MYQTIDEPIDVLGVFQRGGFKPLKFKWRQRMYSIAEVTLKSEIKDGGVRLRQYSVVVTSTAYRLLWYRETDQWRLAEVWCE